MTVGELRRSVGARVERRTRTMTPCRRLRFELVQDALPGRAARRRVLDAGTGEGALAIAIARRHPDWEIVAADLDAEMLDRGRRRCAAEGVGNVRFVQADLTAGLDCGGFDIVLAVECLTEIREDERALRTMARALRPGGRLLAHVPAREWEPVLPGSERTWRLEVRHGYEPRELAIKLRRAGLVVDWVRPTTRGALQAGQDLSDRLKRSSVRSRGAALPLIAAAERLERWGLTWGENRALFAQAHRP